jgi:hypothetical protein
LGIASLVAYARQVVPTAAVDAIDLNLATWHDVARTTPGAGALLDFVQGRQGDFYDAEQAVSYRGVWSALRSRMRALVADARHYVETGEASQELDALLAAHTARTMATDPEWVGISVLFLEQVPFAAALAVRLKQGGGASAPTVVLGGAAMSALHVEDLLAACPSVDGIMCGEGEAAMEALCSGAPREHVPGLVFRSAAGLVRNRAPQTLSLKQLPAPDFSVLPLQEYFNPAPVLPVLFSRGCAWRRCRFCTHNSSFGGHRKRPVDAFVAEIEDLYTRFGVRHIYSADEYIPAADMDAITDAFRVHGLDLAFSVLGRPTEDYTPERLAAWSAAGCRWIGWGVESGSQRLLDLINKGTNAGTIERVIRSSADAGISNLAMMIFGLPTSTDADLYETFGFLERIYDSVDALGMSSFVLCEGTHFARNAAKYGLAIGNVQNVLRANGVDVRTHRLDFRELADDGSLRPPRGPVEVKAWQTRRPWLGPAKLLEQIPCEHCLLHLAPTDAGVPRPGRPRRRAA